MKNFCKKNPNNIQLVYLFKFGPWGHSQTILKASPTKWNKTKREEKDIVRPPYQTESSPDGQNNREGKGQRRFFSNENHNIY